MVKKLYKKIIFYSLLGGLLLASCLEPVDYGKLANDPRVEDYIESKRGLVRVDEQTTYKYDQDQVHLVGGNKIITGFHAGKYYMVHNVLNKEDILIDGGHIPQYVTNHSESAGLHELLEKISHIEGGVLNSLTNGYMYTVRDASPFKTGKTFLYSFTGRTDLTATIIEGSKVNLSNLHGDEFTMDLSEIIPDGYDYVSIHIDGVMERGKGTFTGEITQATGTMFDYVFKDPVDHTKFYFLRVNGMKAHEDSIRVTFTLIDPYKKIELIDKNDNEDFYHYEVNLADVNYKYTEEIVIKIDNFSELDASSVKWYFNEEEMGTGDTLTLTIDESKMGTPGYKYLAIGSHKFTVTAKIDEIPYSALFVLDISYEL